MPSEAKILLVGFGGPESPSEIRPFILSVLAGRSVTPSRIEEVVSHYQQVGGRSPYNEQARRLAAALESALAALGSPLPVVVGLRHSQPHLTDVLEAESRAGTRRLIAVAMTPYEGADAGGRYAQAVRRSAEPLGPDAPRVVWTRPCFEETGFIAAWASLLRGTGAATGPSGSASHIVFTAHSVPLGAAEPYRQQVLATAGRIASRVGLPAERWSLAWQSRSGPPEEAWLEPDVCDLLARLEERGVRSVLAAPIGFVCDHVEVLYDLGVEARARASDLGLDLRVVPTVGEHPLFVGALAALALEAAGAPAGARPAS